MTRVNLAVRAKVPYPLILSRFFRRMRVPKVSVQNQEVFLVLSKTICPAITSLTPIISLTLPYKILSTHGIPQSCSRTARPRPWLERKDALKTLAPLAIAVIFAERALQTKA